MHVEVFSRWTEKKFPGLSKALIDVTTVYIESMRFPHKMGDISQSAFQIVIIHNHQCRLGQI